MLAFAGVAQAQRRQRLAQVQIAPTEARIAVGERHPFIASALDAVGDPVTEAVFAWTSSNPGVAAIGEDGIAVGVSPGMAIITVRSGTGQAARSAQAAVQVTQAREGAPRPSAAVAVQPQVAGPAGRDTAAALRPSGAAALARQPAGVGEPDDLVVRPVNLLLVPGERRQLEYRFVRDDGSVASPQPLLFALAEGGEQFARVDSVGLVTATSTPGRTMIRAAHPANPRLSRELSVEVRADTVRFARPAVAIAPASLDTLRLWVPAQNRELAPDARLFTFTSSDTSKVFVRPQVPILEARGSGTATVTAESPYHSYPIAVLVTVRPRVARLEASVRDTLLVLVSGERVAVAVRGLAADSSIVPGARLVWTASDSAVARYDTAALAILARRPGKARVAVAADEVGGVERSWMVRVLSGAIAPAARRVGVGVGDTVSVSVVLADSSGQHVRGVDQIRWASASDSVLGVAGAVLVGRRIGRTQATARSRWDSTATVEAYVVGDLVVTAFRGGHWDLYAMRADGVGGLSQLTRDSLVETDVAWSPELTRLVYTASPDTRSRTADLYVVDVDGQNPRRLTNDSALVASPSFLPSGEQIVFESSRGGRPQINIMGLDGSNRRLLTAGDAPCRSPSVSPDGRTILFVSSFGRVIDVYEMNLDGSNLRRLTDTREPEASPRYGPGGRSIYFLRQEGPATKRLYRLIRASGAEQALTPVGVIVESYGFSADGRRLALRLSRPEERFGFVNPVTMQFEPIAVARSEELGAPFFRPATPPLR